MIRALTLLQPWATFCVLGLKRTETRSWNTSYRGLLLIHASQKTQHPNQLGILERNSEYVGPYPLMELLGFATISQMPRGGIIGCVELTDTYRFGPDAAENASPMDRQLGNFTAGRYGLCLEDPVPFRGLVSCRGYPSLWTPNDDVVMDASMVIGQTLDADPRNDRIRSFCRQLQREILERARADRT